MNEILDLFPTLAMTVAVQPLPPFSSHLYIGHSSRGTITVLVGAGSGATAVAVSGASVGGGGATGLNRSGGFDRRVGFREGSASPSEEFSEDSSSDWSLLGSSSFGSCRGRFLVRSLGPANESSKNMASWVYRSFRLRLSVSNDQPWCSPSTHGPR